MEAFKSCGIDRKPFVDSSHSFISFMLVSNGVGIAVTDPLPASERLFPNVVVRPFRPRVELRAQAVFRNDRPASRLSMAFIRQLEARAGSPPVDRPGDAAPPGEIGRAHV